MTISWKKGFIRWRLCASWIFANLFWIANCKLAMIADFKPDSLPLQYGSMSQMEHRKLDHWDKPRMRVLSSNIWKIRLHKERTLIPRELSCGTFFCIVGRIHGNSQEAISKLHRKTCFPFGNKEKMANVTPSDQFTKWFSWILLLMQFCGLKSTLTWSTRKVSLYRLLLYIYQCSRSLSLWSVTAISFCKQYTLILEWEFPLLQASELNFTKRLPLKAQKLRHNRSC